MTAKAISSPAFTAPACKNRCSSSAILDVVEARREDWSMDPFVFVEKDGYFYGRGTGDIKDGDAFLVTSFHSPKKGKFQTEIATSSSPSPPMKRAANRTASTWLLKNHRDLIDAEYIINPDAGDFELENGKRLLLGIQASEKLYQDFDLKVTNRGRPQLFAHFRKRHLSTR